MPPIRPRLVQLLAAMIRRALIRRAADRPSQPADHPHSPRPLKYGWAFAITAAVLAELLLGCREPLHPLVLQFLVLAGLERTCDQPEPPPAPQVREPEALTVGPQQTSEASDQPPGPAAGAGASSGPPGG
jgi:hypothetical protein